MTQNKKIFALPVGLGLLLFFSWLLRAFFANKKLLFWLGFLTSFGLAFSVPLIVLMVSEPWEGPHAQKRLRQACLLTFWALAIHECLDRLRKGRVFDILDIVASGVGVVGAYLLYRFLLVRLLDFKG